MPQVVFVSRKVGESRLIEIIIQSALLLVGYLYQAFGCLQAAIADTEHDVADYPWSSRLRKLEDRTFRRAHLRPYFLSHTPQIVQSPTVTPVFQEPDSGHAFKRWTSGQIYPLPEHVEDAYKSSIVPVWRRQIVVFGRTFLQKSFRLFAIC